MWELLADRPQGFPEVLIASKAMGGWIVLDIDASLVDAESGKEAAAVTWKKGYGFHPLLVTCDNTDEMPVLRLRPGNAGSDTATDHISVLRDAVRQIPADRRRRILIRIDGAGASHAVTDWITSGDGHPSFIWEYSTGFALGPDHEKAIARLGENAWESTLEVDGGKIRPNGEVAALTGLLDMATWPGMRILARREHPCAKHSRALTAGPAQPVVQHLKQSLIPPATEEPVGRRPVREVHRQRPPLGPVVIDIQHRVDHLPVAVALRPPAAPGHPRRHRHQRADHQPLSVREIRGIHRPPCRAIRGVAVAMRQAVTRHGAAAGILGSAGVQQGQQGLLARQDSTPTSYTGGPVFMHTLTRTSPRHTPRSERRQP